jgi:hypothetical protein
MIQPIELKLDLPMMIPNGVRSTTTKVWDILVASKNGNLDTLTKMADECPELMYAQYNYTPPIHFAVREGHIALVRYLLAHGAHTPGYKTYPFQDTLQSLAEDRGFNEIMTLLNDYETDNSLHKFSGDNGEILYNRTALQEEFQKAVYDEDLKRRRKYWSSILNLQKMKLISGPKAY